MKLFQKLISLLNKYKLTLIKFLLHGKQISLTSDNTTITSNNFNVDKYGNMTCNSANITGGSVVLNSSSADYEFRIFNNTTGVTTKVTQNSVTVETSNERADYQATGVLLEAGGNQTFISANYARFGGDVYGRSFNPTSLEEQKKNFELMSNALKVLQEIDIYKYNFKDEKDDTKKHIGFVIGKNFNYSKQITTNSNNGVDLYSFVSLCCKAIQEQQEQIEQLQNEIKELKGEK